MPWDIERASISRLDRRLAAVTAQLSRGTRDEAIFALQELDEDLLVDKLRDRAGKPQDEADPAGYLLQNLLGSASWLDPDEAARLARAEPAIWETLGSPPCAASKMSFLLQKCRFADA